MDTKEKTCAERIDVEMASREEWMRKMLAVHANEEEPTDEIDDNSIYEFPYEVQTLTVTKVVMSGGGPADWLEITRDGGNGIVRVAYHFQDWFDGAVKIADEGSSLYRYAEWLTETE